VGQTELWERFQLQAYAAIRQRIDLQCKLQHYDRAQAEEYVKRHLAYAGAEHDIFSDSAIDEIYRFASGAARLINKVCTHCLFYGALLGLLQSFVSRSIIPSNTGQQTPSIAGHYTAAVTISHDKRP